jgi:hypothetical protein
MLHLLRHILYRWFPRQAYRPLFGGYRFTAPGFLPIHTPTILYLVPYRIFASPSCRTAFIQTARLDHYSRLYAGSLSRN